MIISAREMLERLRSIDPIEEVRQAVEANPEPIVADVKSQLYKGEKGSGDKIKAYKNPAYARKKNRVNPEPGYGIPDYNNSGDTYNQTKLQTNADGYEFYSTSVAFPYLQKREGGSQDAFEQNKENRDRYVRTVLQPFIIQSIASKKNLVITR